MDKSLQKLIRISKYSLFCTQSNFELRFHRELECKWKPSFFHWASLNMQYSLLIRLNDSENDSSYTLGRTATCSQLVVFGSSILGRLVSRKQRERERESRSVRTFYDLGTLDNGKISCTPLFLNTLARVSINALFTVSVPVFSPQANPLQNKKVARIFYAEDTEFSVSYLSNSHKTANENNNEKSPFKRKDGHRHHCYHYASYLAFFLTLFCSFQFNSVCVCVSVSNFG